MAISWMIVSRSVSPRIPCSLETACFSFSCPTEHRKTILNPTQLRKRPLSGTVGNHEAQEYAKGNFSIWKSRVQLVSRNKQIHSQFYAFSVTVIKISFLLVENGVEESCKLHKFFCHSSLLIVFHCGFFHPGLLF